MAYDNRKCVSYAGAAGGAYRVFTLDDGTTVTELEIDRQTAKRFMHEARVRYNREKNGHQPVVSSSEVLCGTPEHWQTIERALDTWGYDAQEAMAAGEIGELLSLFGRRAQGRTVPSDWVDEIADVIIMMHSLAIYYGRGAVSERVEAKLNRLAAKLDECEG